MEEQMMPQGNAHFKNRIPLVAGAVVVLAAIGYMLFGSGAVKRFNKLEPPLVKIASPADAEKAEVLEAITLYVVSGIVKEVKEEAQEITLDIPRMLGVEIPPQSARRTKTVRVTAETGIAQSIRKSDEEFRREMQVYNRKGDYSLPPPSPDSTRTIQFKDLKVGDSLLVESMNNTDIKDLPMFEAAQITRVEQ